MGLTYKIDYETSQLVQTWIHKRNFVTTYAMGKHTKSSAATYQYEVWTQLTDHMEVDNEQK